MVSEIRDKATRRRLAVLPYELRFKEPLPEYVRLGEDLCLGIDGEAGSQGADGTGSGASWGLAILLAIELETACSRRSGWEGPRARSQESVSLAGLD